MAAGRAALEPTDEQRENVEILVAIGTPETEICAIVRDKNDKPSSDRTLRKHFQKEIEQGAVKLNSRVANFMLATIFGSPVPEGITPITDEKARAGLMVLFAKARLKWKDTRVNEVQGKDGGAIFVQFAKADENL
jgi:hypothetical protein